MKKTAFIFFFIFFSIFVTSAIADSISYGIQPSSINIFLSPQFTSITVPYRIWNQGQTDINITIAPVNISNFTDFGVMTVLLPANVSRLVGYTEIPITFRYTGYNTTVNGGIYMTPVPQGNSTLVMIPQIFANIIINQTDVVIQIPPYIFPNTTNTTTTTSSSSGSSGSSNSGNTNIPTYTIPTNAKLKPKINMTINDTSNTANVSDSGYSTNASTNTAQTKENTKTDYTLLVIIIAAILLISLAIYLYLK